MNGHDSPHPPQRVTRSSTTFLDMPQATHLFFIDADIAFKPEAVQRLLDIDQDVVAGMYPIKNNRLAAFS